MSSDQSSSSPIFGGSSSSSSYARRYLPNRNERRQTQFSTAAFSVRSVPNTSNTIAYCSSTNYSKLFIKFKKNIFKIFFVFYA